MGFRTGENSLIIIIVLLCHIQNDFIYVSLNVTTDDLKFLRNGTGSCASLCTVETFGK